MPYIDDDEIIEDGGSVRVNMMVMDAARRPTDAVFARRIAQNVRAPWVQSLTDSWKMTPGTRRSEKVLSGLAPLVRHQDVRDARRAANAAYDARSRALSRAWMRPGRDAAPPDDDDDDDNGDGNGNNNAQ